MRLEVHKALELMIQGLNPEDKILATAGVVKMLEQTRIAMEKSGAFADRGVALAFFEDAVEANTAARSAVTACGYPPELAHQIELTSLRERLRQ